jgi:5-methylcytosine-specific restriction endonuclease McrA/biotin operon repressor
MTTPREDPQRQLAVAAQRLIDLGNSHAPNTQRWRDFDLATSLATEAAIAMLGPRPRQKRGQGGKQRILACLLNRQGQWVSGEELQAAARIGEWARRVRELRVEEGWPIEEDAGRYRLTASAPDEAAAQQWRVLNGIRRREGNARDRIRALFEARVGEVVTRDELDYVARIKEGSRRTRELRDEEGWPIESHIEDPVLKPGQYRLASADDVDRRDPRQRLYPENVRSRVFERDNFTCQECGRDRSAAERVGDRRFYLEIHHRNAVADQLDALTEAELNDLDNLVTLCHADHVRQTASFQRRRRSERRGP